MKHQFALYVDSLSSEPGRNKPGSLFTLSDTEAIHRITSILRLTQGEELLLFDRNGHAEVAIIELSKKKIICTLKNYLPNKQLKPAITVLLPILKREAFEEAIYATVELGATTVQPVITEKAHRSWGGAKEKERMERIMIAAAEQSKNFSIPVIHDPLDFKRAVESVEAHAHKLFFDPSGQPLLKLLNTLYETKPDTIVCAIGPEADLSTQEKEFLTAKGFHFYALTPTILRASQALAVGLGAVRSL